ncbi:Transcription elongation factor spt4 [Exophiala mesophila]|uniref:Transcription elongation factor SPT4 n=1 Tax=Exophiala mesophila TaxID=212818 RepID=A0A438MZ85_EXOME|nr:Transcription elongation factor spt4 [Exophiala mesophila]
MTSSLGRNARACMVCSLVQPYNDFFKQGCPNCESILTLKNSQDAISECTSQVFEGLISLGEPKQSWVAKWQRLTEYVPGIYATKVVGQLPREILESLEDNGIKYIPRDGSSLEDDVAA